MSLSVYKASAGSGKTYTLAVEMICILLQNPDSYKNSLAITFTNKASGELKTRVVSVLNLLSQLSEDKGYLQVIRDKLSMQDNEIQRKSKKALSFILHDYSQFSISTIDKFFNRILSGFSYEANIRPDSEISLDDKLNREEALDELLNEFDVDEPLGKWLVEYTRQKIDDNANWNIRQSLLDESNSITQEDFLQKESLLQEISKDKSRLEKYRNTLYALNNRIEKDLKSFIERADSLFSTYGFEPKDIKFGKNGGIPSYIYKQQKEPFVVPSGRAISFYEDANFGVPKNSSASLQDFIINKFHPLIVELFDFTKNNKKDYFTTKLILQTLNNFGVFLDLNKHLRRLCQERHIYFPFQMSQLLHEIVVKENALFVYEKIGSRYLHYMLDEFQDTSRMQWDILKPLLEEGLSQDGKVLVVGDVKQSIYRWRNGDWTLLDREVEASLPGGNSQSLDTNFRSCRDLVRFNNHLIRSMIPVFTKNLEYTFEDLPGDEYNIESLYSDYKQTPHSEESPYGYVHFEVLSDTEESTWKEQSVESMIAEMERLQSLGYSPGDMAVLTRKNKDASEIALRLMDYDKVSEYSFPVVSASSLDLIEHPAIKLIIAALTHITDPQNKMALNQLAFAYRKDILGETDYQPKPEEYSSIAVENSLMEALPKAYVDHYKELAAYPLFDLVENVILWFDLRNISGIYSYLTAFQDQVLNYSERNSADISAFLLWFEKKNPSLDLPESSDAIVISTLHKAKGLQYKFVFIPVTDWDIEPKRGTTSLWLEPKHPPFNQYPVVMVNYSSDMKYSHFQGASQDEYFKKQVDMLNMFYVAITRAEEGLWMWAPEVKTSKKSSKSDALSKMSDILVKSMMQTVSEVNDTKHFIDSWEDAWNDSKTLFRLGEIIPLKDGNVKDLNAIIMDNYGLNIRDSRLRYHHPEAFIDLNQDEMIRDKIERGSVAHEVLEKTFKQVDLPEAIENVVRAGRIGREDAVILETQLESAMSRSQIKEWFNGDFEVLNEHEIILPDGNVIKPDRVMVYEDSTVVVDYKFGKKHSKHYLPQVTSYMDALKSMGYPNVQGYLWYVFLDEVQEVNA